MTQPIMERTTLTAAQSTICAMLRKHGIHYHHQTDPTTGLDRILAKDSFVCQGRYGYVWKDVTDWSLHRLGCWLGY